SKTTLFVRNVPFSTTNEQLEEFFSDVGPIRSCFIVRENGESKGFGYCSFAINEDAKRALKKTQFTDGRVLKLEFAKRRASEKSAPKIPKKPRPLTQLRNIKCSKPCIVVRNLAFHCTEAEIREAFEPFGTIKECRMAMSSSGDDGKEKFRGFCFIEYEAMAEANKAVQCLNGKKVSNRRIAVDFSLPKEKYDQVTAAPEAASEGGQEDEASDVEAESSESEQEDEKAEEEAPLEKKPALKGDPGAMLFIRNLSFDSTEEDLRETFEKIGPLKYARITKDKITGASRGTGFVCFKDKLHSTKCLEMFKTAMAESATIPSKTSSSILVADPSSSAVSKPFILAGRFLNVAPAVNKDEAAKLALEKSAERLKSDKRNLYLMREGVIYPDSELGQKLSPSEMSKRQASFALRRKLLNDNPNLFISKTRISVRNLGRSVDDAFLKYLAKYGVIGFWKQVEAGERQPLEEVVMQAEQDPPPSSTRKIGIKQAKIVRDMDRMDKTTKLGRSKGYGFVEFVSHADALACLRFLNSNATAVSAAKKRRDRLDTDPEISRQTPIVEFAMENILVLRKRVQRTENSKNPDSTNGEKGNPKKSVAGEKRKRGSTSASTEAAGKKKPKTVTDNATAAGKKKQKTVTDNATAAGKKKQKTVTDNAVAAEKKQNTAAGEKRKRPAPDVGEVEDKVSKKTKKVSKKKKGGDNVVKTPIGGQNVEKAAGKPSPENKTVDRKAIGAKKKAQRKERKQKRKVTGSKESSS
ncbi:MAG: hypothetical protein SGCHY_000357, partial [Lobulomycetales sp.]